MEIFQALYRALFMHRGASWEQSDRTVCQRFQGNFLHVWQRTIVDGIVNRRAFFRGGVLAFCIAIIVPVEHNAARFVGIEPIAYVDPGVIPVGVGIW